ncbi:MAG: FHA domain-containing protein [Planctomycetaceae bacterium]
MFAQLVPLVGGEPIVLHRDINIVGREQEGCDVVIDNKSVSKMHCIVVKTDGCLFVRDLSSTNGTRVNGQKVVRGALLPNDVLQFASEKSRVHLAASAPGANSPSGGLNGTIALDLPIDNFPRDEFPREDFPRGHFESDPLRSEHSGLQLSDEPPAPPPPPAPPDDRPPGLGSDVLRGQVLLPEGGIDLNQIDALEDLDDPLSSR